MDEKLRFIYEYERDEETMRGLCRRHGISRETGYVWLRRFRQHGAAGLVELNRAPRWHPNPTRPEIEEAVLQLREAHMKWGPRKLKRILERDQPGSVWPAASTMGEIVKRAGLVVPRKKRRRTEPYTQPLAHANQSNRVWCADFKGWFRTKDSTRIDPLTITDASSRYLLRCQIVERTDFTHARAVFEAAFREFGMPGVIHTDNGVPFASVAPGGLSRLSMWFVRLGITPQRSRPGSPQDNGRHERMHRTLKQATATPPEATARLQQKAFDAFRHEFNQHRPHQALGDLTPAACYQTGTRLWPRRLPELEYADDIQVRRVSQQGSIRWKGERTFISEVFRYEPLGLRPHNER